MILPFQKINYSYFSLYCVAFYSFLIHLNYKREFPTVDINTSSNSSLINANNYSSKDISPKENKIFLDLKYRNGIDVYSLKIKSFSYIIDLEGKIIGHRSTYDQNFFSNDTMNLNKKLLHSTLFGSIKLMKI